MNKLLLTNLMVCATLAGCSGSGGSGGSDGRIAGNINGISGIAYSTESVKGIVNAEGRFQYKEGETITFSLGGLTLGSVIAEPTLEWHDIFGDVPSNAQEIRTKLRAPLYSKQFSHTETYALTAEYAPFANNEFHVLSNTIQLLLALDEDRDENNGLDLLSGNWNTQLENENHESIGLDSLIQDFRSSVDALKFQQRFGVSLSMAASKPLEYLYSQKGLTIPAKVLEKSNSFKGESEKTYSLNEENLFYKIDSIESFSDISTTTTYNSDGLPTKIIKDLIYKNVGSDNTQSTITYAYNSFGYPTQKDVVEIKSSNGQVIEDNTTTLSYLNDRVLVTQNAEFNNMLSEESYNDVEVSYINYNDNFDIEEGMEVDEDRDGNTLSSTTKIEFMYSDDKFKNSNSFDEADLRLSMGPSIVSQLTYEANKNIQRVIFDDKSFYQFLTEEFSENGLISKRTFQILDATSDTIIRDELMTYTFNLNNQITGCLETQDYDGNGVIDEGVEVRFTYNENGLERANYSELQNNGNYEIDEDRTQGFAYGDEGQLTIDSIEGWEHTYASDASDVGISYLVSEYLEIEANIFGRDFCNP